MSRLPLAILFLVWCLIMPGAGAEELERRVIYPEKAAAVSLHLREGGPFVEAKVNGQPARFMVRPELNFSQISKGSVERLGLKGVEGYDSVVLTPVLSLGGAEIKNEPWQVEDWSPDERKLDGMIGYSTLREFTVELNYPDDELTLMKPEALPPATVLDGVMEMMLTEEDITLQGTKVSARRGGVTLSSIAAGGVRVPLKLETMRPGKPTLPEKLVKDRFPGLSAAPGTVIRPDIKLGPAGTGSMEFQVTAAGAPELPDDAGVLTPEVLKYFKLTLDYAGRRARMTLQTAQFTARGAEFKITPDEKLEWCVVGVKENSPAQQAGLEKGDLLVSVAGVPCRKMVFSELTRLKWGEGKAVFARGSAGDRREIEVTWTAPGPEPVDPLIAGLLREWTFPEGRDAVEIPITFPEGRPAVEVKVNGQTLRCLLDTGASSSLLTAEAAARAGLKKVRERQGLSVSNELAMGFEVVAETVEIGGLTIRREPWGVTELPDNTGEGKTDGWIGMGTLRDFVVRIDWKAKKMTLWKRGKEPAPEGGFTLPLQVEEWPQPPFPSPSPQRFRPAGCRMVIMAGGKTFPCVMDTGSDFSLTLSEKLVREKLPEVAAKAGPLLESGIGVSGVVMMRSIRLPEFTMGNETLTDMRAGMWNSAEGNVGRGILRHYTITVDVDGGRLHFLPYGTLHELKAGSTLGFSPVYRDKRLVVGAVTAGGPAEAAGIKVGDVIDSINGRKMLKEEEKNGGEKEEKEEEKEEKPTPPGTEVKVKAIRGGVEMEFTVVTGKL